MNPPRRALAQSESKARFFDRLSLDANNEFHRRIYAAMKEEAVEGQKRINEDPGSLQPELRDSNVKRPYSHSQVNETAMHAEILRIYQRARPETRQVYDLGRDTDRVVEENWVIRWMLWHVFRYRDNRNRNRRAASANGDTDLDPDPDGSDEASGRPYWDPVRER